MIQGLLALQCGLDQDRQVFLDLILADQFRQALGAQSIIHTVVRLGFRVERAVAFCHKRDYT